MKSIEIYQEERAEARACGDLDVPPYSEWLQNLCDPHAERKRAEERFDDGDRGWSDELHENMEFEGADDY